MQKTGLLLLNFFLMQPRTSSLTLNCFCDFDGPVMNKVHGKKKEEEKKEVRVNMKKRTKKVRSDP